ncbi:MAG: sigma-54-dependent transcriptional regulator [Myxococcales bacterium]|jgi:DNA-binding NtrC family response regulator
MNAYRVLVVDDDAQSLQGMQEMVRSLGHAADGAASAEEAASLLAKETYDLVIADLVLPGQDGLGLIRSLRKRPVAPPVVLVTGHASLENAIEALRAGASDYFTKPLDPQVLKDRLQNLFATPPLPKADQGALVSESMTRLLESLAALAPLDTHLLLWGEPGAGKEWCAGWLHERSRESPAPLVRLHAAALPAEMVASELLGAPARQGRLEQARGGALFIDDIELLDPVSQRELSNALETGTWTRTGDGQQLSGQVRLIAATSCEPGSLLASGRLIESLWRRLEPHMLHVPALRERPADIAPLARHFASCASRAQGREVGLSPEALDQLSRHPWPGNVRELKVAIERAVARSPGALVQPDLLPAFPASARNELRIPVGTRIKEVEREMIMRTLEANGGNKNRTAKQLGISRRSLYNKLERYRIGAPEAQSAPSEGGL